MRSDDPEMARLRAAFGVSGRPPDPESCPAPEAILSAVRDELPREELRAIVDHTAWCHACAEDWRLAVAFEERASRPWLQRLAPYAAAAAAAVLLLAIGLPSLWKTHKPVVRGPDEAIHSRTPAKLPRRDCQLVWTGLAGATYKVEVFTLGHDIVATATDLRQTSFRVSESALRDFPADTTLQWQVTPTLLPHRRGPPPSPSPIFHFVLQ